MAEELPASESLETAAASAAGPNVRGIGLVALGGTVGTLARYVLDALVGAAVGHPLGIFVINITGAFALGVVIESLSGPDRGRRRDLQLLLGTGLIGGYTTYSLLATDIAELLIDQRVIEACGYGLATIVVGASASWAGIHTAHTCRTRS